MKKGLLLLVGFVVVAALAVPPVFAQEGGEAKVVKAKPEKGKREKGDKEKGAKAEDPFGGDGDKGKEKGDVKRSAFGESIDDIDSVVKLTEDQRKKLTTLKEARDKDLEKYDKANEPRITKAHEQLQKLNGMDPKKDRRVAEGKKELEGFLAGVQTGREQLIDTHDKRMFAALTPEQRAKWNTPILKDEMMKEFSLVFLEGKQEEKIDSFCQTQAKRLAGPLDPVKSAKALDPLKLQVYKTILTPKQQEEYRKIKSTTAGREGKGGKGEGKKGG